MELGSKDGIKGRTTNSSWFTSYLFSNLAAGLTSPLIPLYVVLYLHDTVLQVGIVSSLSSAAAVPSLIVWGNLSDYIGRRKIFILTGFFGSFLTLLQIIFVADLAGYIIMLVSFQILAMAAVPVSTLLILETRQENEWPQVMSTFSMVSAIGTVIGLGAGSLIIVFWHYFWVIPAIYLISSFVYLTAAVIALVVLPEPHRNILRTRIAHVFSFRTIERARHFPSHVIHIIPFGKNREHTHSLTPVTWKYLITTTWLMFGFQIFVVPFPVFFIDVGHAGETEVFLLYLINGIFSMMTFRFSGLLIKRNGIRKTLIMGIAPRIALFLFAAVLALLASQSGLVLALSLVIYGVLGGLWSLISIGQVTSISKLALQVNRGKAIGYYNSLLGLGQIGGAAVSGYIAISLGYSQDFVIAAAVVIIGTFMIMRFDPDHRQRSDLNVKASAGLK